MRKIAKWAIIAAALLLAVIAGNFVYGWTAPGPLTREVTVVIKPGSSITLAAEQLEKGGVIKSADAFVNRAKIFGATSTIKAGEFRHPASGLQFRRPVHPDRRQNRSAHGHHSRRHAVDHGA